jgi:hypothetical protein
MKPFKYDPDGTPIFSSTDIDDYGMPELYGYEKYRVVESREIVLASDYKFESTRDWRPIHRYDREQRFRITLLNLLGERGNIPPQILIIMKTYMKPDPHNIWNEARRILKHFKLRKYYDQIPTILRKLGHNRFFPAVTAEKINSIVQDFKALVSKYNQIKHQFNRKYFPNIRFIALKLLELHSMTPLYYIPKVRTSRKSKSLNLLWEEIIKNNKPL